MLGIYVISKYSDIYIYIYIWFLHFKPFMHLKTLLWNKLLYYSLNKTFTYSTKTSLFCCCIRKVERNSEVLIWIDELSSSNLVLVYPAIDSSWYFFPYICADNDIIMYQSLVRLVSLEADPGGFIWSRRNGMITISLDRWVNIFEHLNTLNVITE